ncbi:YqiA/YcfP family alpha/beta fold hydrolase [Andreprevotia chitinilytica]|uniref:YqiA/YcfP family alpha/beta fold hydrolase n=1 Tax=Andreprevotia chitinilytica TaxID=396808 RepID=UPI000A051539|nr:YqiA/YcfP family alpha/beta fold hydrolase [Andreprevotia chitinilytica]
MTPPHLVYLHGFLSSPFSQKAQDIAVWMAEQHLADYFHCPQLPMEPVAAGQLIRETVEKLQGERICFVGSSLGGYFATWAVEEFGGRAVLINPAVKPYEQLKHYIGPQRNYQTGELYSIEPGFADALRAYDRVPTDPSRYWLLTQTDDEVLDYREAVTKFAACRQTIEPGGNHGFVDFPRWLPEIWAFANQTADATLKETP